MAKGVSLPGVVNRGAGNIRGTVPTSKWILASGAEAIFTERNLSYDVLRERAFVDFEINGRLQDLLNEAVLERLESLNRQQFTSIICIEHEDGRIEVLDGSNRLAYMLSKEGAIPSLRAMVTRTKITKADAQALAKEIRSTLEQCLYEIGQLAKPYSEQGMGQREIASKIGFSQSKVNRGLKTVAIPKELMTLFPSAYDISWPEYQRLIDISERIPLPLSSDQNAELKGMADAESVIVRLEKLAAPEQIKQKPKQQKPKSIKRSLYEFPKESRKKAEYSVSDDGKISTYRFVRVGREADAIIEQKMKEAMEEIARLDQ